MSPAVRSEPRWRPLRALLGGALGPDAAPADLQISDLTLDSREVRPGGAFLACQGGSQHGLRYAEAAMTAGARVILWEPAPGVDAPVAKGEVLCIAVPALREQAGYIADRFFDAPSTAVAVTGITGTNGKTTCAWLLAEAFERLGLRAAYLGTVGQRFAGQLQSGTHTTPDAVSLHRQLALLRDAGARQVALEVSSHALDQHRCAGVRFRYAAFTNLSRDHLDYHGDMASYGAVKARLFSWPTLSARVINVDDEFGARLAESVSDRATLVQSSRLAAGARTASSSAGARRVLARSWRRTGSGLSLELDTSWGESRLDSPLIGEFNVDNLLTALAVLLAAEVSLADACRALGQCSAPPGRMQASGGGELPLVLVDYAHTPAALELALRTARAYARGRLVCVFGCGGERDAGKRPLMGRAAADAADELVVTDDNPRRESPPVIVDAILAGIGGRKPAQVIHDRASAIAAALRGARAGDVVLVAGKGHEAYQQVGSVRRPFSDIEVVRAALAARSAA